MAHLFVISNPALSKQQRCAIFVNVITPTGTWLESRFVVMLLKSSTLMFFYSFILIKLDGYKVVDRDENGIIFKLFLAQTQKIAHFNTPDHLWMKDSRWKLSYEICREKTNKGNLMETLIISFLILKIKGYKWGHRFIQHPQTPITAQQVPNGMWDGLPGGLLCGAMIICPKGIGSNSGLQGWWDGQQHQCLHHPDSADTLQPHWAAEGPPGSVSGSHSCT